jgi:hypothetical protein
MIPNLIPLRITVTYQDKTKPTYPAWLTWLLLLLSEIGPSIEPLVTVFILRTGLEMQFIANLNSLFFIHRTNTTCLQFPVAGLKT